MQGKEHLYRKIRLEGQVTVPEMSICSRGKATRARETHAGDPIFQSKRKRSRATKSKKVSGTRNHINHAKSKRYNEVWNYHIFAGPKIKSKQRRGDSNFSIELQRNVAELDCAVKP